MPTWSMAASPTRSSSRTSAGRRSHYQTAIVSDAELTATGINTTAVEGPLPANPLPGVLTPTFNVATFTDAGNTTLPFDLPTDYVVSINWGDGTVTTGTVSNPVLLGNVPTYTVSGTHLYADEGSYSTTVTIKDEGSATVTTTGVVTITDAALTAGPAAALTQVEGRPFAAQVATFSDANLAATIADFAATINWGDGTSAAGIIAQLTTPVGSPTQFTVSGSHTYAEQSAAGTPYAITVAIKDDGGSTAAATATATVLDAPLTSAGATIQGVEGIALASGAVGNGILVATVQDSEPLATTTDFTTAGGSVTLDWGDGTPVVTVPAANIVAVGTSAGVTFQVFGPTHTYAEEGSYKITVTSTDNGGAATVAHSEADIADAPLSPAAVQPVLGPQASGVSFTTPVATFLDANPNATADDFTATIDWGDGTPRSTGAISPAGQTVRGGVLYSVWTVTGSHNYIDPFVNGGSGTFPILVNVIDKGGATTVVANTASVPLAGAVVLTGQLDPASDSGFNHFDGITNVNQPRFFGTAEPFATVQLYAAPTGTNNYTLVGQTAVDGSGGWALNTSLLADGSYTILAKEINRSGVGTLSTQIMPNANQGPLVIDTIAPRVTFASFDRFTSTAHFTFQDVNAALLPGGSGLLVQSLLDSSNYSLRQIFKAHGRISSAPLVVTTLYATPGATPFSDDVVVVFNNGHRLVGGSFQLTVTSGSSAANGVQDIAGNALDGEFFGRTSVSGNGVPGGNFVANFAVFHNFNSGPQTLVGFPHPNGTFGAFPGPSRKHGSKPFKVHAKATATLSLHKPGLAHPASAQKN